MPQKEPHKSEWCRLPSEIKLSDRIELGVYAFMFPFMVTLLSCPQAFIGGA